MSSSDTLWQEISVAALLGTQRKPFQLAQDPTATSPLSATLQAASAAPAAQTENGTPDPAVLDPERRLLRATAVTALHRKAGRLPAMGAPSFPPACPSEEWPRCSARAGTILEQMLAGDKTILLPEWVELAAAHHQRVREEHLAPLLSQQKITLPLRRALLPVIGARGRWLAAQNPEWALFDSFNEQTWAEGQRKQRLAYLSDLRAENPTRARELLAATWPQETPSERVDFLEVLAENLSLEDEPFLESVLDDGRKGGRKDVRQAATALLARLPGSRLVRRMIDRARTMLGFKPGLLRSTLEVNLPESCDAAMQRDGIDPHLLAGSKLGEKAWWLAQVLAFVPPATWSAGWNKRPNQILDVARKHEWEEALLHGWKEAAARFNDMDWLEALMAHEARRGEHQRMLELFPRLPEAARERLVITLLRDHPTLSYEQPPSLYLSTCRFRWSIELTQSVVSNICWTLQKGDMQPWRWERLLRDMAPYFNPVLLETAIERISAALRKKDGGDPSVRALLSALEFRLNMRQAFDS